MQVAEVAARRGIYRSLAFQGRHHARDGLLVAEPTSAFVPVSGAVANRRDEVMSDSEPMLPLSRKAVATEIELPDGLRMEVGLVTLRLNRGYFVLPQANDGVVSLTPVQFNRLRAATALSGRQRPA